METKKSTKTQRLVTSQEQETKTATVFTDIDGINHLFEYESVELLMEEINKSILCEYSLSDNDIKVTLSDGTNFWLDLTLMHYCFGKSRISTTKLIELLLIQEEA